MSRVFVANDVALGRRVVVKVLREDVLEGVSRERFRREVLVSANLQHPNIVGVIAAGEADGLPYFVMPYVEGESLRALLRRETTVTIPNAVAILRDIARALAFAHSRGIVHRDIKPDNVLLAGGAAMVADFGVAKALASARESDRHPHGTLTGVGISLGTPAYMAPEQVAGDPQVDHRADLYAVGVTAYEMLVGKAPFARGSVREQMAARLIEDAEPVARHRPGVTRALNTLVARCLARLPEDRLQSADELLALLDDPSVVSGEVASAATPSIALKSIRRRRQWQWLGIGAVMLAAIGVTASLARRPAVQAPVPQPLLAAGGLGIAVFPLVSVSADSADSYVAQGMTEALTNAFAGLPRVRVASRTAAEAAMREERTLGAVAKRLGVSLYVEGTVQRGVDRVRVTVRLVNARDGFAVWSDVYDSEDGDLLKAQSEIASAVADAFSAGAMEFRDSVPG
jgi:serine/threonine-protein kinase